MILEKVYPGLCSFDMRFSFWLVSNDDLGGHYPGGLFNNDTVVAVNKHNNKDKGKNHEVRIPVIPRPGETSSLPWPRYDNGTPHQWTIQVAIGRLHLLHASPMLFFGVFCRILDFLTSLFDLLP